MRRLAALVACAAALWGCGTDEGDRPRTEPGGALVAALGDSVTAGLPLWDPNPGVRARLGEKVDPESQFGYWAQLRLKGEVRFRNCGVGGERTDQIETRLERCAQGAQGLIVQGGVNDIAQGRPVAAAAANLREMVRRGKRLGLEVALADVLPWNDGPPSARARIEELNGLIRAIAREEEVALLRFHDALEDPRRPGRLHARYTDDGTHPSVAGHRRLGELIEAPQPR